MQHAAFGRSAEADLVAKLRRSARPTISLVADIGAAVVGHIFFSPVRLAGVRSTPCPLGLAPLGVVPAQQRSGVGSSLVRAGLEACRSLGTPFVVVLGHAGYYPRFGFAPGFEFGVRCECPSTPESFMALELVPGALAQASGTVHYAPEFSEL